ncbi:acetyltransferase, partial [Vibrio cholerae]
SQENHQKFTYKVLKIQLLAFKLYFTLSFK